MYLKIDHIGIAVKDLEAAIRMYGLLTEPQETEILEVPQEGIRVAMLQVGDVRLELLQPITEQSTVSRFLQRRGPGLHHIAIRVGNIEDAIQKTRSHGFQLIDDVPRPGVCGAKAAFIHPKSTEGSLIELYER